MFLGGINVYLQQQFGFFRHLPTFLDRWLDSPRLAMFSVVLPTIWAGMGPGCIIYLAALQGIPGDLYEAADVDGLCLVGTYAFILVSWPAGFRSRTLVVSRGPRRPLTAYLLRV